MFVSVFAALAVAATPFPKWDAQAGCEANARRIGNPSAVQLCVDEEQGAYDLAKLAWPIVPEPYRRRCIAIAEGGFVPGYSYTRLTGCLSLNWPAIRAAPASRRQFEAR